MRKCIEMNSLSTAPLDRQRTFVYTITMSKLSTEEEVITSKEVVCGKCILGGHSDCLNCGAKESHYAYCEKCEKQVEDYENDKQ